MKKIVLIIITTYFITITNAQQMIHTNKTKTIVFIHGLFMNPQSWDNWKQYFEKKGYTCYAPPYPYHNGKPSDLRQRIDDNLGKLTFNEIIDSLEKFITQLPEKPILIGHSMGGLIVQKLIEKNKAVAGICIDAAPPKGINSLQWSFFKSNLPVINPLKGNSTFIPTVKWFHYAFCNTMTIEETKMKFDKFVVPESRNIPRSSTKKAGKIDFNKAHAPLLIIAGEKDHIIPPSLNRKNFKAYTDKNSITDFKEFEGRTHFICGQQNWEEVADFINNWINGLPMNK